MLDRDGAGLCLARRTFGGQITADTVSPHLHERGRRDRGQALLPASRHQPARHRLGHPINLREGRGPFEGNGGSTITQQTAKLLCLGVPYDPTVRKTEADYEADCRRAAL